MPPKSQDSPETHLPLRPVELLLLTMLSAGDRHGYGLRQDILDHTGGKIELEAGTLYRHIRRLEDARLVAEAAAHPDEDERRIYYRLTPFGRKVLGAEMLRLRSLVRLAESRRIISPARS
ncbi:MAG TPA: PadR family transcriptional regulator [Gemmatimonadales bacterium]|nr:PadR family transcriptional regulator [Gemmatimonadales bacterium]